jgi:2-hydroxychromene-2-carboxylate isomerase
MTETVEFLFDLRCPYSYIAAARLHKTLGGFRRPFHYTPVAADVVAEAAGNPPPAPGSPKARYLREDCARLARYYRVPLAWPDVVPDTAPAMAALALLAPEARPEACRRLFQALWVDGRDIGREDVLTSVLGPGRLDVDGSGARKLRTLAVEAVERGVFGVPSFLFEDEVYFGQDRLFLIEAIISDRILARSA